MNDAPLHVLAGILRDASGRVLLAQRPAGKHLAGTWEFPGGKREAGESSLQALARELLEELGIEIHDAQPLAAITHAYPALHVRLDAWQVTRWTGEPQGLDGQSLAWVPVAELDDWPMPPADRPIVAALRLPSRYAITPEPSVDTAVFLRRFEVLISRGVRLVQLRSKSAGDDALRPLAVRCAAIAERHAADLLINGQPSLALELGCGLHLPASMLRDWAVGAPDDPESALAREAWLPRRASGSSASAAGHETDGNRSTPRQARGWLAASCHDAEELAMAARIGCDFATLSPVLPTSTHPDSVALDWRGFAELAAQASIPVYALGGMSPRHDADARRHGARGIAAIRAFWPD